MWDVEYDFDVFDLAREVGDVNLFDIMLTNQTWDGELWSFDLALESLDVGLGWQSGPTFLYKL